MRKKKNPIKKETVFTVLVLLLLWQAAALLAGNEILIPRPTTVLMRMADNITDPLFYQSMASSLQRMMKGLILSLAAALILGAAAVESCGVRRCLEPVVVVFKTIPVISYIVILLIWLGSEGSVPLISFCVLFPVFYSAVLLSQSLLDRDLQDVLRCYPETWYNTWLKVRIPQLLPHLLSALKTGFGLGLRVCVMAEIQASVMRGIGRQMSYARMNLDVAGLIGWTVWIILISAAADLMFSRLQKWVESSL